MTFLGKLQMTKKQKEKYESPELLRDILKQALNGKKFRLQCGHYVTFGHFLGNDVTIYNGKEFKIICLQCGH
jgi:ribosomal protein S19